jgi:uncharacterized protein YfaS (alpha-2-macroglobulin family)
VVEQLIPEDDVPAAGSVRVTRSYHNPKTGAQIQGASRGELVEVRIRVGMPQDAFYVLVEDKLPGGLEALNENLNSESHITTYYQEPIYYWSDLGYNYKEIHADRVSFFITEFTDRRHTFTYLARATQDGEFTALPTEAYAMYDLTNWGRSASSQFSVDSSNAYADSSRSGDGSSLNLDDGDSEQLEEGTLE